MIAPGARTVGSFALIAILSGCSAGYLEIPIETPIQPKLDVRPFSRVYVAGFVSAGTDDVDGNLETVRLLRSQLRNKGALRVIDADALALASLVPAGPDPAANGAAGTAPPQAAVEVSDEMAFAAYEKVFADKEYWKKVGEEMQQPLIVTGTVLFRPQERAGFVQRERETFDSAGPAGRPARTHLHGAQGLHPAPELHLHRRPHRRDTAHRDVPGGNSVQLESDDAAAVVLLRADGPPPAELPEHAERPEGAGDPHASQVAASP